MVLNPQDFKAQSEVNRSDILPLKGLKRLHDEEKTSLAEAKQIIKEWLVGLNLTQLQMMQEISNCGEEWFTRGEILDPKT